MVKFLVRVTESVNHDYLIEADSREEAVEKYYNLTERELKELDLDNASSWDTPWDVEECLD